jgi:hypothetical protein
VPGAPGGAGIDRRRPSVSRITLLVDAGSWLMLLIAVGVVVWRMDGSRWLAGALGTALLAVAWATEFRKHRGARWISTTRCEAILERLAFGISAAFGLTLWLAVVVVVVLAAGPALACIAGMLLLFLWVVGHAQ